MSEQIHIPKFKAISQKTGERIQENNIFAKGSNSIKIGQTRPNLNLTCIRYDKFIYEISSQYVER